MTEAERVALMAEVQSDELAFALLTAKMFDESNFGRYLNYGMTLDEFGDPRAWPEYDARKRKAASA